MSVFTDYIRSFLIWSPVIVSLSKLAAHEDLLPNTISELKMGNFKDLVFASGGPPRCCEFLSSPQHCFSTVWADQGKGSRFMIRRSTAAYLFSPKLLIVHVSPTKTSNLLALCRLVHYQHHVTTPRPKLLRMEWGVANLPSCQLHGWPRLCPSDLTKLFHQRFWVLRPLYLFTRAKHRPIYLHK